MYSCIINHLKTHWLQTVYYHHHSVLFTGSSAPRGSDGGAGVSVVILELDCSAEGRRLMHTVGSLCCLLAGGSA